MEVKICDKNSLDYMQIEVVEIKPSFHKEVVNITFYGISTKNHLQLVNQCFGCVYVQRLSCMANKIPVECLPTNLPEME